MRQDFVLQVDERRLKLNYVKATLIKRETIDAAQLHLIDSGKCEATRPIRILGAIVHCEGVDGERSNPWTKVLVSVGGHYIVPNIRSPASVSIDGGVK